MEIYIYIFDIDTKCRTCYVTYNGEANSIHICIICGNLILMKNYIYIYWGYIYLRYNLYMYNMHASMKHYMRKQTPYVCVFIYYISGQLQLCWIVG